MTQLRSKLSGIVVIEPQAFGDERGFFVETFRKSSFAEQGIDCTFVQDNHSRSRQGVVRGMHFQLLPGQDKLVTCTRGKIVDVVVDIRRGSPTFGEWEAWELSDENHRQLFCPVGFGHGFAVLSETADVVYKCSNYYASEIERGFKFDDPEVGIEWPAGLELFPSERDREAPLLSEIASDLPFEYAG